MLRIYFLTLISSLFIASFMISCEQESPKDFQFELEEKTGADYLNTYSIPPIMYHYVYANESDNTFSGWLIDNKGKVRTYSLDYQILGFSALELDKMEMKELIDQSEVSDVELDLNVLVQHYKKNASVAKEELKIMSENPESETVSAFYAYSAVPTDDRKSCSDRSHLALFHQTILKYDGKESLENKSHLTGEIVEWLVDIHQNGGM